MMKSAKEIVNGVIETKRQETRNEIERSVIDWFNKEPLSCNRVYVSYMDDGLKQELEAAGYGVFSKTTSKGLFGTEISWLVSWKEE